MAPRLKVAKAFARTNAAAAESPESAAAVGATPEYVANIKLFFPGGVKEVERFLSATGDSQDAEREAFEDSEPDDESSESNSGAADGASCIIPRFCIFF